VLIVDWDAHHGNGTQELFYRDGSVYYLSFHLSGHYPGTGGEGERGAGAGAGATRNVPFGHGTGREAYLEAFERVVGEVVGAFRPELIVVSAGFDCLAGDPLGGLALEPADLHVLARVVMEAGSETAGGRVVALLEGGYVPARIAAAAVEMIRAFAGLPALDAD
ncbi:MAG: histone deacetylase, partial [Gemmatimonadota bacterium]